MIKNKYTVVNTETNEEVFHCNKKEHAKDYVEWYTSGFQYPVSYTIVENE
jgi:hypothetical protein